MVAPKNLAPSENFAPLAPLRIQPPQLFKSPLFQPPSFARGMGVHYM